MRSNFWEVTSWHADKVVNWTESYELQGSFRACGILTETGDMVGIALLTQTAGNPHWMRKKNLQTSHIC